MVETSVMKELIPIETHRNYAVNCIANRLNEFYISGTLALMKPVIVNFWFIFGC